MQSVILSGILKVLRIKSEESGPVFILLGIGFFLGLFFATVSVSSTTLFLNAYSETEDLPIALVISGAFSILFTSLYTLFQGKVSFKILSLFSLLFIAILTSLILFGEYWISDKNLLFYFGFTLILPFTYVSQLIFWGTFNRLFNIQQARRILGSIDVGMDVALVIAFFTIPILLQLGVETVALFYISLFSIISCMILFIILTSFFLKETTAESISPIKKLSIGQFLKNKYVVLLSLFIILSTAASRFIDYSFFNVATNQFNSDNLPYFLSYFEGSIVVFSFLFTLMATDRINREYGLKASLLINPILLLLFTGIALVLGFFLGYEPSQGSTIYFFFIAIAMSKLLISSMKEAIDEPTYRMYYMPLDKSIKIDAQTKIEGIVMGLASTSAGSIILLINQFQDFSLLSFTLFTIPIIVFWYWVVTLMYKGYRNTLQNSLKNNKFKINKQRTTVHTIDSVLVQEVNQNINTKMLYSLKVMEKLEPALFESTVTNLAHSNLKEIKDYAQRKIEELGIEQGAHSVTKNLAKQAAGEAEDSELLSISTEKLMKLGKSAKSSDRILTAKFLRKVMNNKAIFTLLELLRDLDPAVRKEALATARKVKRPETWNILIDMLASPLYSNYATSALKEAGEPALKVLNDAFYKSGQSDLVIQKIIKIIGFIGSTKNESRALSLMWEKINHPDKRVVKYILYSLREMNYIAKGKEASFIKELLDVEMSKMLWNMAAKDELPSKDPIFALLREALEEEVESNYDHITLLLSLLYDPQSVQLVKDNLDSDSLDSIAYAIELLNLFIDSDLKPKIVPLFDDSSIADKLEKLQPYFHREQYTPYQTIKYILNRNINYNNRWTKMCAIYVTVQIQDFQINESLIAQIFNQDRIIQEATAWVIYNKDKELYDSIITRIPRKDRKFNELSIEKNQIVNGLNDGFFLGIEMVMVIKKLSLFKNIKGDALCELINKIEPITLQEGEDKTIHLNEDINPIIITAYGEIKITDKNENSSIFKKGKVFGDFFQDDLSPEITKIEAIKPSVLFLLRISDFYFILANHHELLYNLIENGSKQEELYTQ